jgi:hypothetical protein
MTLEEVISVMSFTPSRSKICSEDAQYKTGWVTVES